jgi:Tfp pilus assembly protein PilX
MRRNGEHGGAMLVTLIVITALLAGAVSLASIQAASSRSVGLMRDKNAAVYCAEAGLATARSAVAASYAQWNAALAAGTQPSWLASLDRDLDKDGSMDFELTLRDNDDESGTDDPAHDNDLAVFVTSTCVKYPETPVSVAELVRYSGGGNCYQSQLGGCGGNNNGN